MRREQLMNNAATTLTAGVDGAATALSVASPGVFSATGDFRLLVEKELVLCTAVSGNSLTVVRGIEGTTAAAHVSGVAVVNVLSQGGVQAFLRDNIPLADTLPPLRLVDNNGNPLTLGSFTVIKAGAAPVIKQLGAAITVNRRATISTSCATWLTRPLPSQFPFVVTACVGGMGLGRWHKPQHRSRALQFAHGRRCCHPLLADHFADHGAAVQRVGHSQWCELGQRELVEYALHQLFAPDVASVCSNGASAVFSISSNGLTWTPIQYQNLSGLFGSSLPDKVGFLAQSANAQTSTANLFAWDEGANPHRDRD